MDKVLMAYVARTPSGVCTGCVLDEEEHRASTAACVAQWIRRGDVIARVTAAAARAEFEATLRGGSSRRCRHGHAEGWCDSCEPASELYCGTGAPA